MNKNDILTVKIEDMNETGEGIGKYEGYTLFVKDACLGDLVRARITKPKKNYAFARLEEILEASPFRVEPPCPVHRTCGGCQLQALSYEKQLEFKEKKVRDCLTRIGGFKAPVIKPIIGMENPLGYRNKAQFPFGVNKDGRVITGFYAGRTHCIIENQGCLLGSEQNEEILSLIKEYMEENGVSVYDEKRGKGLVRHALIRIGHHTGEIMVCLVINGKKLPYADRLISKLITVHGMTSILVNVNTANTNVILGKETECIWGKNKIVDRIGELSFEISARSFFQVNSVQTEKLYAKALEYAQLKDGDVVWDLYCGIGTISLFMAQQASKVYGVEIVEDAIRDARENAVLNGITNVEFFVGKAEEIVPEKMRSEGIRADVIVVDPPRKGCEPELLEALIKISPRRIVYVSCSPSTLARDLKYLCSEGYELVEATPCDMFGMSSHVETVCLLTKVKRKEVPAVEFSFQGEVSEEELQELLTERNKILASLGYCENKDGKWEEPNKSNDFANQE